MTHSTRLVFLSLLSLLCVGCSDPEAQSRAVGQLESRRIEMTTAVSETLVVRNIEEGSNVNAGDIVFSFDQRIAEARLAQAQAQVEEQRAALAELLAGTRIEQLQAAQADVAGARQEKDFRQGEVARITSLVERELLPEEQLDQAQISTDAAVAAFDAATARLRELTAGARQQTIEQAAARLQSAEAVVSERSLLLEQHAMRAPENGRLDHYLFEQGERPNVGQVIAVLLADAQPYARIYLPADIRSGIAVNDTVTVQIDGLTNSVSGRIRWIANEATFTPYFALTKYDRDRLSYLAKVDLEYDDGRLPDGVPVEIVF